MDDLLSEFLTETAESLEVIDVELVRFEANPRDEATLNNIFRLVHTIKGTCGFLGLPRLEGVAHASETLLGRYRDKALEVTPQAVTTVLGAIDRIKLILGGLRETGQEPPGDDSPLINALNALSAGETKGAAPSPGGPPPFDADGNAWDVDQQRYLRPGEVSLAELEAAFRETAVDLGPSGRAASVATPPAPPAAPPPAMAAAASGGAPAAPPSLELDMDDERRADAAAAQTIRVNVEVLEALMTTVSELVLTRNQLLQMVRNQANSDFKAPLQRLSNITVELQDRVMKTRMQPVGAAWRKLPRIVRNASNDLKKKIDLRLEGEATELDRQVLELIKDPLTHMVRNSCDHGLELPEIRKAAGKPETGSILLSAYHEGGAIIIELSDDGAGLNTDRIRDKAIDKGLITAAEAAAMSDTQIHRFIFAPGFSTADKVTNMSGRGVGMDVVKTNIEQIGGSIELSSERGKGSRFKIKIPLTLAIVSALVLGARGQRFAAPQSSVVELVSVGASSEHQIETINAAPVLRLRDALLPLLDLSELLGLPRLLSSGEGRGEAAQYVAVLQVGGERFGLIVDHVHDTEEIVVKPLATLLRGIRLYSGATILGDGSVVMILDPNGLADALGAHREREDSLTAGAQVTVDADETRLIVFRAGPDDLKAAPLELITRLEEIEVAKLEKADGRRVVQFRGQLMPVMHIAGEHAYRLEGRQPVLVFMNDGSSFGLAVDQIVDIVQERVTIDLAADRPGIIGAAVIKGLATEIVDVGHFLELMQGDWRRGRRGALPKASILLLDPSAFSRSLMTPLLQAAGYSVTHANSPEEARTIAASGARFDVVLADLDADPDAAATFAMELVNDPVWSRSRPLAISRDGGAPVGPFLERVSKSDRGGLLSALEYVLRSRELAA